MIAKSLQFEFFSSKTSVIGVILCCPVNIAVRDHLRLWGEGGNFLPEFASLPESGICLGNAFFSSMGGGGGGGCCLEEENTALFK